MSLYPKQQAWQVKCLRRQVRDRSRLFSTSRTVRSAAASIENHDIVVVGGGPAGLTLTAALTASRSIVNTHKVTLLEAAPLNRVSSWSPSSDEYSNRVSSITAENVAFLEDIGVWKHLDRSRSRGIEEMQVWDGLSNARINFHSPTIDELTPYSQRSAAIASSSTHIAPMATLIENLNLQRACMKALEVTKNLELVDGTRVINIKSDEAGWPVIEIGTGVEGASTRRLRAKLLVGADGYNSPVKTYSNIESFGWAYNNQGIVASLQISPEEMGIGMRTAWQRFLPEGPIAFLPLSDTASSLVWSTTPELAAAIKKLPLDLLARLVNAAFTLPYEQFSSFLNLLLTSPLPSENDLSDSLEALVAPFQAQAYDVSALPEEYPPPVKSIQPGSVASFPLRLSHADSYLGLPVRNRDMRTALVGDAAHTIHPLAGQGLNMGLGDIQALVRTLEETVKHGGDVGSYNSLKTYPRARYIPNHAILSTCDHLASLYGSKLKPIVWARSTGLEIVNELDSLKKLLMGGAGATAKGRGAGAWGVVAGGLDTVGKGLESAKMLGGVALGQLKQRFAPGGR